MTTVTDMSRCVLEETIRTRIDTLTVPQSTIEVKKSLVIARCCTSRAIITSLVTSRANHIAQHAHRRVRGRPISRKTTCITGSSTQHVPLTHIAGVTFVDTLLETCQAVLVAGSGH